MRMLTKSNIFCTRSSEAFHQTPSALPPTLQNGTSLKRANRNITCRKGGDVWGTWARRPERPCRRRWRATLRDSEQIQCAPTVISNGVGDESSVCYTTRRLDEAQGCDGLGMAEHHAAEVEGGGCGIGTRRRWRRGMWPFLWDLGCARWESLTLNPHMFTKHAGGCKQVSFNCVCCSVTRWCREYGGTVCLALVHDFF
jgi:hypothetical protein